MPRSWIDTTSQSNKVRGKVQSGVPPWYCSVQTHETYYIKGCECLALPKQNVEGQMHPVRPN